MGRAYFFVGYNARYAKFNVEQTVDYGEYGDNGAFHPDSQDPQKRLQSFNITNYSILIIKSIYLLKIFMNL